MHSYSTEAVNVKGLRIAFCVPSALAPSIKALGASISGFFIGGPEGGALRYCGS
jgi:hypothetical protein